MFSAIHDGVQYLKGMSFLFRFIHAIDLAVIPFIMECCLSHHSLGHTGRMAWASWIINMVFRTVVMETQSVSYIWIIKIRHILNIAFNWKKYLSPKDKSFFPQFPWFSEMNINLYVCGTNPCFVIKLFSYFCVWIA